MTFDLSDSSWSNANRLIEAGTRATFYLVTIVMFSLFIRLFSRRDQDTFFVIKTMTITLHFKNKTRNQELNLQNDFVFMK